MWTLTCPVRSTFKQPQSLGPEDNMHYEWIGKVQNYTTEVTEDDFEQCRMLWHIMIEEKEDQILIENLAGNISKALPKVREEAIAMFAKVDKEIGDRLQKALEEAIKKSGGPDHVNYGPYGLRPTYGAGY
jgi:catalase